MYFGLFSSLQVIEIPAGGELLAHAKRLNILPGFALEGIPNRDSVKYADLYGISTEAHTVFRGSLRYEGAYFFFLLLNKRDVTSSFTRHILISFFPSHIRILQNDESVERSGRH